MTARAIYAGRYGWVAQWADGAYTFEATEADARTCERYPALAPELADALRDAAEALDNCILKGNHPMTMNDAVQRAKVVAHAREVLSRIESQTEPRP